MELAERSRPPQLATPPPTHRVPLREKIALGLGFATSLGAHDVTHVIASSVYNVTMGMSPVLVSIVLFAQRVWGALLEPVAGQYSDNFRSRFGRRRPLLALSIGPMCLCFALMWMTPRGANGPSLFVYVLVASILFYTARAFYLIPLLSLQVEATNDYHERTRLSGTTQIYFRVFAVLSNWVFVWVQSSMFPDTLTGVRTMGWTLGGFFLVAGLAPVFFARERLYEHVATHQGRASLAENFRTVCASEGLLRLLGTQFLATFGYNVVGILGMYATYYYVYAGDIRHAAVMQGWAGTAFQIAGIGAIFAYRALSRKIGKRRTLQVAALVLMIGSAAKMVLFQPGQPWLIILVWGMNGAGVVGINVMALSMLADSADFEEARSGARREGLYSSSLSFCGWLGYSIGALLSGFILVGIGFDAKLGGGQSAAALLWMRILYSVLPFAGALAAAIVIGKYPLTEQRMRAIKQELDVRRAAPA